MSENKAYLDVDDSSFDQEVMQSDRPVLVDFWAQWCGPCRMVAPVVEQVAKDFAAQLKVCKVNVDSASATAARFGIMSIPTLAIFKNGNVADQIVGAVSREELENKVKQHL